MPVLNLGALLGGEPGPGAGGGGDRPGRAPRWGSRWTTRTSWWARACRCCADETLPWARAIAALPDQVYVPLLDLGALAARLTEVST